MQGTPKPKAKEYPASYQILFLSAQKEFSPIA